MFRYEFEKAVEQYGDEIGCETILYYPKQLVIFLGENKNIKNELYFRLRLPDEQEIKFKVSVMKYWEYCAEDLKDKKMYVLLPLQVFKSRKSIKAILYNPAIKEEGIREGMKKGVEKGRKNVAINMLKENLDIDLVVKFTGYTKRRNHKFKAGN